MRSCSSIYLSIHTFIHTRTHLDVDFKRCMISQNQKELNKWKSNIYNYLLKFPTSLEQIRVFEFSMWKHMILIMFCRTNVETEKNYKFKVQFKIYIDGSNCWQTNRNRSHYFSCLICSIFWQCQFTSYLLLLFSNIFSLSLTDFKWQTIVVNHTKQSCQVWWERGSVIIYLLLFCASEEPLTKWNQ